MPAAWAASRPATTSANRSRRVISWNVSERIVSRLTLTRSRPASLRACAVLARPERVGGQRGLRARLQGRRTAHDVDQPAAHQRLAAGEPHLAHAQPLHGDGDQPDHLVVAELRLQREPVEALLGHAVGAAQVAAVGQADAQVGGYPAEGVCERLHYPSPVEPVRAGHGWDVGLVLRVAWRRALVRVPAEPALGRVRAGRRGAGVRRVVAGRVAVPPAAGPEGRQHRRAHQRAPRDRARGRRAEPGPRPVRAGRVAGRQRDRDLRRGRARS